MIVRKIEAPISPSFKKLETGGCDFKKHLDKWLFTTSLVEKLA